MNTTVTAFKPASRLFWRLLLAGSLLALIAIFFTLGGPDLATGRYAISLRWRIGGALVLLLAAVPLAGLVLSFTRIWQHVLSGFDWAAQKLRRLGWLNGIGLALTAVLLVGILYRPLPGLLHLPDLFAPLAARLAFLWLLGLAAAAFLKALLPGIDRVEALSAAWLGLGVVYTAAQFLPAVNDYPFSLGWSEASRYFYGSQFLSKYVYGFSQPWPFLHPSRYLLLAIPFLLKGLPLIAHRLWQVLLWLGLTSLTSWLLVRRVRPQTRSLRWIGWLWVFLFLFQGPVYYHLQICVILILAFFNRTNFWRSLLVVAAASIWAGISRVNWFPMPAAMAILIYLLETPRSSAQNFLKYFTRPVCYGLVGMGSALASQFAYIRLSGQPDAASFGSSFTSDLLWNRLLPSPNYAPGILPMILLLTLPLLVWLVRNAGLAQLHVWRVVALLGLLLVFLAGGLVVSTKIGGGSNLHNLDSYITLLAIWAAYQMTGKIEPDGHPAAAWNPSWLLAVVVALPLLPAALNGPVYVKLDWSKAQDELSTLRQVVEPAAQAGKRVLFISQRQLVMFKLVDAPLEPGYETLELMEWAMSNNKLMLSQFYHELQQHEYDLIVVQTLRTTLKDSEAGFAEENNAWAERIAAPILKYYKGFRSLPGNDVEIYAPRK